MSRPKHILCLATVLTFALMAVSSANGQNIIKQAPIGFDTLSRGDIPHGSD